MERRIYAYLKSFPKGMNSNVDPLLLPNDQLSFASNATVRGDFISQRPPFYNISLSYDSANTSSHFQAGLFQGAAYYRTTTNGLIMVAVAGRLFQIAVNADQTALVSEIALPSVNSPTAVQNWLWQAENFLIWNDGVNLPIFYDGNITRRSYGAAPTQLGSAAVSFTVPAQNQYVSGDVQLNNAWTAGVGMVLIGQALYYVQSFYGGSIGGRITIGLNAITYSGGDLLNPGAAISLNNKNAGTILAATDNSLAAITNFPPIAVQGTPGNALTLKVVSDTASGIASTVALGTAVSGSAKYSGTIVSAKVGGVDIGSWPANAAAQMTITLQGPAGGIGVQNVGRNVTFTNSFGGPAIYASGTFISTNGVNTVTFSLDSLLGGQVAGGGVPPIGTIPFCVIGGFTGSGFVVTNWGTSTWPTSGISQVDITLSQTFSGAINDILQVGTATMKVIAQSGALVTCQMVSNSTGVAVPIGGLVVNNTKASATPVNYGSSILVVPTIPAVGSQFSLDTTVVAATPVVGQILYFNTVNAGAGGVVVAVVLASSGGVIGQALNYFRLTLSIPFAGNVSDSIHVGSGNTLATLTVTSKISASIIQCQMTNTPVSALIPITSATPTASQIVVNDSASGALTGVGTYPLTDGGSPANALNPVPVSSSFTLQTLPGTTSAAVGQIVQISTSLGATDLFQIVSVSGGSVGTQPKIRVQNINDIEGSTVNAGTFIYSVPEFDVSKMGVYGMGRNWVALADGTEFVAGDLVGATTGTQFYKYKDAVLKVSQNYFLAGGGTFSIPGSGEQIRAMQFTARLDASLGQGALQVFTDDTVFSCEAPTDITVWSKLASPILIEGLIGSGAISQNAVVQNNGDLMFRLSDGGVQSMLMARLDFHKWGNTPISKEVTRSIVNDPPALYPFTSMAVFNNRMLMTCKLAQAARGVYGAAMVSLNFDPISSLAGKAPTVWESEWSGLNVLQIITGFFNGSKQCYALCLSNDLTKIELHQIQQDNAATVDNGNSPITWFFESPMLCGDNPNQPRRYKRLVNGEFSFHNITADVSYQFFYSTDQNPAWIPWYSSVIKYQGASDPGYRRRIPIGMPSPTVFDPTNNQPTREGYNFQIKIQITGSGTPTDIRIACDEIDQPEFAQPK